MEELQKLYNVLVREGKYSKSFEEFQSKWSNDQAYKDKVYNVVVRDGLYSKDKNSFLEKYSPSQEQNIPVVKKKDSSESSEAPQEATTVSPSEDGSSATPQKRFSLTTEDLKDIGKKQPTDMSGKPLLPKPDEKLLKSIAEKHAEQEFYRKKSEQELAVKKLQAEKEFEQQGFPKIDKDTDQYLNNRLNTIDDKLINKNEEYVVPQMNYQFGDLGFKFEESGATGDWMVATAPNGKKIEISLDPFMSSKAVSESDKLKQFIKENTPDKGLYVIEKTFSEENQKINSQKQVDTSIKKISDEANNLNLSLKNFLTKKNDLDKLSKGSPEYLKMQQDLIAERDELIKKQDNLRTKEASLKRSVGKYTGMKGEQGNWLGATWNWLLEGSSSISAGVSDLAIDVMTEIMPNEMQMSPNDLKNESIGIAKKLGIKGPSENQTFSQWKATLTEDQQDDVEDEIDDIAKKFAKKDLLPAIREGNRILLGDKTTTPEWEALKQEGFWGGAYAGLVKSVPAMIGGAGPAGWAQRTAQFYSQVSDGIKQEMDQNPKFNNISENEKLAVTLPIGITGAVLEDFGLRNIKASQGLINKITLSALGKAGMGITAKSFRELVENEVESRLAKGLLTLGAAGLAEAETGSAQQAAEYTVKDVYNSIKHKKVFKTPETVNEWIKNVAVAGAQEAVGGFVLGMPTSVSVAYTEKGFLKMDDNTFKLFESAANDDNIQRAFITNLKTQIAQGTITTAEAKEQLNNYRNAAGLFRSLPEGLDTKQKKEAMNLLKEKRDLENYVDGKDPALVVKQKNRIAEINSLLTNLSEKPSAEYIINDKPYSKEEFLKELEGKTPDELKAMKIVVNNDEQTSKDINEKFKTNAIQEQTTDESVLRAEQPGVELQGVGEGNAKPVEVTTEEKTISEEKPQEVVFSKALEEPSSVFVYDGKKGQLTTIGQTVVLETPTEVIDLGNVDELSNAPLSDFGIHKEEELNINLNDDNSVDVNGTKYLNNYSEPESAINVDKDGNYSVTLDTENGQKRTFRGQQADSIVYQMKLKNFEQNGTAEQIERANELADEAIRIETETRKPSVEREGKTVRKGKRIVVSKPIEVVAHEAKVEVVKPSEVIETFEDKARKLADEVMNLELPDWLKADIEGGKAQGSDVSVIKKALADAIVTVGRLMDKGVEFSKAIKEASKELIDLLGEDKRDKIENEIFERFNKGQKLNEESLPGYEKLSSEIDNQISASETIDNVLKHTQDSEVYKSASDVQKEALVRDVRKRFGLKEKSAPSVGKLLGTIKDVKKITMTEKAALVKQIKDKARGAKDVILTKKEIAKELAKEIKEIESSGKITVVQAANIVSKLSKVNLLNDVSVSNFVDYMTKVFADAEYDNKINIAKGKLENARKNINTKIGVSDGLVSPLQRLFAINPTLIPESKLERYLELVDMFGARQAVLTLEEKSKVTNDVIDILDEINNERSAVEELSERLNYSENKVIEDDKLSYAATVKNMLKEGEITEKEAELMTKYKSEILPRTEKSTLSEEELQQEKDELLSEVKKSTINADDLPTRSERDAAKKLAALIKSPAVKELSNAQLKNLLKVIDNINNGYFAHSAQLIIEELNSNANSKTLTSSVKRAVLLPLSKLYTQGKSILTRKDAVLEMIRRNPLFNIDQVLGDFKTKDVFNSLLEKAAEGEAKFTSELKAIQSKLSNAEEKIAKSFTFKDKLNANKVLMSKFKMMTYMVQLEYESNPDSKQVNPASKFIEATINHIDEGKSQFKEKDAEMLQKILNKYTDTDGNIDIDKLYNSFNSAEKAGIKTIQEINQSLKEKAEHTASVVRGQRISPLSNYIHLNVLSDTKPNDLASGESFADQYNSSLKPSTKAKSLIERTGKVSPLNFDVFASAQKGAKYVLMDYHLTEPIRTARKTINKSITELGKVDKEKKRIINAINNSFEETVENLVKNNYMETSLGDDVANYISKQGYRSVLAGTGRFAAEFLSNVGFVIVNDPMTFAEGLKYTPILMSTNAPSIMNNVNSKEINRIFPSDTLSGRMIDTNILNEANGIKGGKAKNEVINRSQQIWNLTGKKYKNAVELTADILITTPDKAIMRPIWFGAFATNFKNETGQDVDFEKIAENDEVYMNKHRDAIEKAKNVADEKSVLTGASNNHFSGILKGKTKPNQSVFVKGFNNFNNFMTRFLIYEYTSARTGIMAAIGNGSLSKKEGIALLGAVTTRMTVYSLLSKALGSGLIGLLFGDDDDEEEQKKSLDKSIGQALTSSFTSMLFNRDFGNSTKMVINEGIERINENYLQELREGDYDPYKDAIQYTAFPIEKKGKQTGIYNFIENMSGSYSPAIKTTNLIVKTYSEDNKKESDAIQRQKDVKNIRIPLEVLGNSGFIPLYKDIRKEVMKQIYKGIDGKSNSNLRTVKAGEEFK